MDGESRTIRLRKVMGGLRRVTKGYDRVFEESHKGVKGVLNRHSKGVTNVIQKCDKGVKRVLQWCYFFL